MRIGTVLVIALLAAGCSLKTSSTFGGGSTAPASGPASSSSSSEASAPSGDPNARLPVPDLTGKTPDEARAALRAAGFGGEIEINRRPLECVGVPKVAGKIDCQDPQPGKLGYARAHVSVNVHEERGHEGRLIRDQLIQVRGKTVAEATKYLRGIGATGKIDVWVSPAWISGCEVDIVCNISQESGTSVDGQLTLVVNPGSAEDPDRGPKE